MATIGTFKKTGSTSSPAKSSPFASRPRTSASSPRPAAPAKQPQPPIYCRPSRLCVARDYAELRGGTAVFRGFGGDVAPHNNGAMSAAPRRVARRRGRRSARPDQRVFAVSPSKRLA